MIIVTLARKPLIGTVAETLTRYGTGALNINDSRIRLREGEQVSSGIANLENRRGETGVDWRKSSQEKMTQAQKDSLERTNTLGRWPSNFILQHSPQCVCAGVKKVKSGNATLVNTEEGRSIGVVNLLGLKRAAKGTYGHADESNQETVPNWICAKGCPVAALDAQSGTLPSGTAVRKNQGVSQTGMFAFGEQGPEPDFGYADEGTASRFFKQIKE